MHVFSSPLGNYVSLSITNILLSPLPSPVALRASPNWSWYFSKSLFKEKNHWFLNGLWLLARPITGNVECNSTLHKKDNGTDVDELFCKFSQQDKGQVIRPFLWLLHQRKHKGFTFVWSVHLVKRAVTQFLLPSSSPSTTFIYLCGKYHLTIPREVNRKLTVQRI